MHLARDRTAPTVASNEHLLVCKSTNATTNFAGGKLAEPVQAEGGCEVVRVVSGSVWSNVDESENPAAAVGWQEKMAQWPFCQQYKRRTVDLMDLEPGDCVLDIGCGPGADLLLMRDRMGEFSKIFGLDSSDAMVARANEQVSEFANIDVRVGDAHALPFAEQTFNAVRADRVLQHLADAHTAVRELMRVTKSGGRIVVVDPDQDTIAIAVDAEEIEDKIRAFRKSQIKNPTIAHRIGSMLADMGATRIAVEARTLVLTDPNDAFGLVEWPEMMRAEKLLSAQEVNDWKAALKTAVEQGSFFYSVTFFITCARKK